MKLSSAVTTLLFLAVAVELAFGQSSQVDDTGRDLMRRAPVCKGRLQRVVVDLAKVLPAKSVSLSSGPQFLPHGVISVSTKRQVGGQIEFLFSDPVHKVNSVTLRGISKRRQNNFITGTSATGARLGRSVIAPNQHGRLSVVRPGAFFNVKKLRTVVQQPSRITALDLTFCREPAPKKCPADDKEVRGPPEVANPCDGQKPDVPNIECIVDDIEQTGEQSGTNVTLGYQGLLDTDAVPITTPFFQAGICPVNVHWHLGAEHLSVGEYDENGKGPKVTGMTTPGFMCNLFNKKDEKFTKKFDFKYCKNMEVGQTYEIHWPHSAAGACGTQNQYQTPFLDGVFCNDNVITDTAAQIGVQAQVFTIVNDESLFYPDLIRGMIVDGVDKGMEITKYTGSTTGTSVSNEICSQFTPITWHVDRKCHLISASSFDKLCADMLAQNDDMSDDVKPHGSRELVADELAADNHQRRRKE